MIRSSKLIWFFLKFAITALLIIYVSQQLEWKVVKIQFYNAEYGYLIIGFILITLRTILVSHRIQYLLREQHIYIDYRDLLRHYFIGYFFGIMIPGRIGGDLIRGFYLSRHNVSVKKAAAALIVERVLGLLSLTTLPVFIIFINSDHLRYDIIKWGVLLCLLLSFIIICLFIPKGQQLALNVMKLLGALKYDKVEKFILSFGCYTFNKMSVIYALILSYIFNIIGIFSIYLYGLGLKLELSFSHHLLYMPLVWVVNTLPLTIGGFGIREEAMLNLYALAGLGIDQEGGIVGLMSLSTLGTILIGYIVWVKSKRSFDLSGTESN